MVQPTTAWVESNSVMKVRCATLTMVASRIVITEASTQTPAIRKSRASSRSG